MSKFKNQTKQLIGPLAILFILTFLYIYPGSSYLFSGRSDIVLSDDTDPAPLTYGYQGLINTFHAHPERFFFGAVALEGQSPEGAIAGWYPWIERWLVIAFSPFIPLEQIPTAVIYTVMFLTAVLMYLLARFLNWNRSLSLALAIAWAFTPFTRARAKVHGMLAGTFHVPAIFLGLLILAKGKTWKSALLASGIFMLCAMTSHYYIVTSAFLTPLLLVFYYLQPEARENLKLSSARLGAAVAPAVFFLAFNLAVPTPPGVQLAGSSIPKTGETSTGEPHPFLYYFSARPIDFISGDIGVGVKDLNPIKAAINRHVLKNLGKSNSHERSNGIRWIILLLACTGVYYALQRQNLFAPEVRKNLIFFALLAVFSFWLSMSPDFPTKGLGLSGWLHSLVSQIRVPSRSGILVNFSLIMMSGIFLHALSQPFGRGKEKKEKKQAVRKIPKFYKWMLAPAVLPAIMIIELPPLLQNPPVSKVRPIYSHISRPDQQCGAGMLFPFTSPTFRLDKHYHFIQRMRKSNCLILNQLFEQERLNWMLKRFAFHPQVFKFIHEQPQKMIQQIQYVAQCIPMTWIIFDQEVPDSFMRTTCRQLGWTLHEDRSCTSTELNKPLQRMPEEC